MYIHVYVHTCICTYMYIGNEDVITAVEVLFLGRGSSAMLQRFQQNWSLWYPRLLALNL